MSSYHPDSCSGPHSLVSMRYPIRMPASRASPTCSSGIMPFEHDLVVVTTNVRDLIELLDVELHPGLIVMREAGLSRTQQWARLEPVLRRVLAAGDPNNRVIEV